MAAPTPNIQSILDVLKAVQPAATAAPSQASYPPSSLPPSSSYAAPLGQYMPPGPPGAPPGYPQPQYQAPPPASYGYPAPSASGSIDLSSIRPVDSGTVSLQEAISQARNYAAQKGLTPHDRPVYPPTDRASDGRNYRRSRSRSPPRRDGYRENPYRDERRDYANQNRDYNRDRSASPGPRHRFSPRGGHNRDRSPRGQDDNMEMMEIDATLVGLIIGRQGENLRRIEGDSGCRVQFIPPTGKAEPFRMCKISGPPAQRAEARAAINKIIQDSSAGPSGRPPRNSGPRDTGNNPPIAGEGETTIKIMVPDRTVGLIIGRGGETIRDLQERSLCHINIVSESKSVNGLRPVNLIGTPEATKMAKDLIMEIVDSDSRNSANRDGNGNSHMGRPPRHEGRYGGGEDKVNDMMYVPAEAVGMIIGKGGETIREMQATTGCKINVSQDGDIEREVGLVGSPEAISRAKQAIQEKVDAVRQKGSGGGGGGGRGRHRDYDNPNFIQPSNNQSAAQSIPPTAGGGAPGAPGASDDPYAPYGGYANYAAMWYQAMAAAQQQPQADGSQPPRAS